MGSKVGLVKSSSFDSETKNDIKAAINLTGFKKESPVKSVIIKPNLCYYWESSTGQTTDPRVVAGAIDWVRETFGPDVKVKIAEADASAMRTRWAFLMLGYEKLARAKNVELFNLCTDRMVEKEVSIKGRKIEYKIPASLLDSDLFINMPKLKTHSITKTTCAFKNIYGCIGLARKFVYHPFLDEAIVGINKILHPDLIIVDGLVAGGRFPVRLGLIMAGTDPYSVDSVASRIMGYGPSSIGYLRIARQESLGSSEGMVVCGENIETFKGHFPKPGRFSSQYWWDVKLKILKAYARIANDVIPPLLDEK